MGSEEIPDAITDKSTTNASNANGDVLKSEDTLELNIPLPKDIPDARPSADPSEVDAKPLSWSRECAPPTALSVPTARSDSLLRPSFSKSSSGIVCHTTCRA